MLSRLLLFSCCHDARSEREELGLTLNEETAEEQNFFDYDSPVPEQCAELEAKLRALVTERPYLKMPHHAFHYYVRGWRDAVLRGDTADAQNAMDNLTMELDSEEKMIAAAFRKFDTDGSGTLQFSETQFMLDYLGFPDSDADVRTLVRAVDADGDDNISFDEFVEYVGNYGGSAKLFEVRRSQIEDRARFRKADQALDPETTRFELQQAGIQLEEQAAWRLVAGDSEFDEAARLRSCQRSAVRHIRALARENHERALPALQERVAALGYTDRDLWMCLAWIRELAPVIVHVNLDRVGEFLLKDTHYRNQFETRSSGGLLNTAARVKWERGLFGQSYEDAEPFERPKYGVQNIWNDPRGVQGCKQYGDSYFVLKDVRLRCTFSPEDSANLPARRLSVLDFYAHVLMEYSNKELIETIRVAERGAERVGDSNAVMEKWGKYKEAQIHGEVDLDRHVDRLVVHERHRPDSAWVEAIAKKHNWELTWMLDMKTHLESKSDGRTLDEATWKKQLKKLGRAATTTLDNCTAGKCRIGCGRPCVEGLTVCCRGCELGFGHDVHCGETEIPEGFCKQGCGRRAKDGEQYCCRRCGLGTPYHDRECGMDDAKRSLVDKGLCKQGCGRKAAPGLTRSGRSFDTCCRNCAGGKGHSSKCIA
eukprot:TRINITY_DN72409_c0_g1_i1.p1 TRINITY_DN72409_c0_g1~~TRINITY_DN72409_c0_g1_i1.p1  ORF type:complete len:651 (+),score=121.87 TRINITY_DN72409_c0_g1_i1:180-2132(+)